MKPTDKQELASQKANIEARLDDLLFKLKRQEVSFRDMMLISIGQAVIALLNNEMQRCKPRKKNTGSTRRYEDVRL